MNVERVSSGLQDVRIVRPAGPAAHPAPLAIIDVLACQAPQLPDRLRAARAEFAASGAVVLSEVPIDQDDVLIGLSSWFGDVTRMGNGPPPGHLIRDLTWAPDAGATPMLELHTDSAYSPHPHAAIALGCAENSEGDWGNTELTAISDVVDLLSTKDIAALTSIPVRFAKMRSGRLEQQFDAPILSLTDSGATCRFNPEHLTHGVGQSAPLGEPIAEAIRQVGDLVNCAAIKVRTKLEPNDLLVIDNWRVLHGRTALGGRAARHLRRLKMMAWAV